MPPQDIQTNQLTGVAFTRISNRIDQAINDDQIFPAASLAIYHNDALIFNAGWGWIDPDTQEHPVNTETLFDLASVTKLYTTVAFLSLVSTGKVSLYTPVVEIIPEFGKINPRPIDGGQDPYSKARMPVDEEFAGQSVDVTKITCWHLLTHTSGLPPWRDVYNIAEAPKPPTEEDTLTRIERWSLALDRLCTYPFVGQPDTGVRYSDIGLMLLGEVVSRVYGSAGNLDTALIEHLLQPLTFEYTTYRPLNFIFYREDIAPTEFDATWRKRRAWGEVHDENACGVGGVAGHAGLFAPAEEVAILGNAWLNHAEAEFGIDPELAAATVELQAQTGAEVRGLGWMLKSAKNSSAGDLFSPKSYGHTGFTGTSLWIDPDENLVVALLTNRVYPGREKIGIHALRRDIHDMIHQAVTS